MKSENFQVLRYNVIVRNPPKIRISLAVRLGAVDRERLNLMNKKKQKKNCKCNIELQRLVPLRDYGNDDVKLIITVGCNYQNSRN